MKSYRIHLIRHGVSEGAEKGQYIGATDSPLSENGKNQLKALALSAQYPKADAYFCSANQRCRESLELLYPGTTGTYLRGLEGCNFGEWEGKTAEELQGDETYQKWMRGEEGAVPPGGEGNMTFMHRVCEVFEKLVDSMMRSHTENVVLVTQGDVIMALCAAYGLPRAGLYEWMCEPGHGYTMQITPSLWMRSMVAEVFCTLPHFETGEEEGDEALQAARQALHIAFPAKQPEEEGK